jgi:hypothetical protein
MICDLCGAEGTHSIVRLKDGRCICKKTNACREWRMFGQREAVRGGSLTFEEFKKKLQKKGMLPR